MSGLRLSTATFAELVGISRQKASQALARCEQGKLWRGVALDVIAVTARGGRSGVRYEVALSSLSEALQRRFREELGGEPCDDGGAYFQGPAPAIGCGYRPAPNQSATIEYRWRVIQEAIDAPARSIERKNEVLRAHKKWGDPVRTIYNWIKRLETSGGDVNALARKLPADAGQRRVWVSREFDKAFAAAGHDAAVLPELGSVLDHLLQRAWASPAQRAGWRQVRRVALTLFQQELKQRGLAIPTPERIVSQRRVVESAAECRQLDIRENDRKRFDDTKPRIRRANNLFAPMSQVVMDVKPIDCIVPRADGSEAWPRMIGFLDTGTSRTFRFFVLLNPGEGVRQEHVIDAFKAMVSHPEWGFPQQLYRDNGTEFAVFDKIRSALALINEPGARTIINAKPYSGASKPIESKFATLDRFVFSQMGGWAGGNRMNKKTQTVGKPPKPYSGSFDDFAMEADRRIEVFEHQEINSGPFKGKTPAGIFADQVASGWRPVAVNPLALEAAFAKRETRVVDRGALSIGGQLYRHPELPNRQEVAIALPYQRGATPLVLLPEFGWAALQADMPYLPGDIAGARDSSRMQTRDDRAVRTKRKQLAPIDDRALLAANVTALPTRAAPAPLIDLDMSEQAKSFAGARIEAARIEADKPSAAEAKQRRIDAETRRLERQYGSHWEDRKHG